MVDNKRPSCTEAMEDGVGIMVLAASLQLARESSPHSGVVSMHLFVLYVCITLW